MSEAGQRLIKAAKELLPPSNTQRDLEDAARQLLAAEAEMDAMVDSHLPFNRADIASAQRRVEQAENLMAACLTAYSE